MDQGEKITITVLLMMKKVTKKTNQGSSLITMNTHTKSNVATRLINELAHSICNTLLLKHILPMLIIEMVYASLFWRDIFV
jgi:hypothetical protein